MSLIRIRSELTVWALGSEWARSALLLHQVAHAFAGDVGQQVCSPLFVDRSAAANPLAVEVKRRRSNEVEHQRLFCLRHPSEGVPNRFVALHLRGIDLAAEIVAAAMAHEPLGALALSG